MRVALPRTVRHKGGDSSSVPPAARRVSPDAVLTDLSTGAFPHGSAELHSDLDTPSPQGHAVDICRLMDSSW